MQKPKDNGQIRSGLTLAAPFLVLLAVSTWHHAPWGDELHAWGLAVASANPIVLFHNLHYDGHPGLWHIMLWSAASVSHSPFAMQAVHAVLAAAAITIVAIRAPFSRTEKILLLLNYFIVFEYAVLARNYGMTLLLAIIYAQIRGTVPERPVHAAGILGLMANTNIYGVIVAGLLGLEYLWNYIVVKGLIATAGYAGVVRGCVLFGALLLLSAATVWPAADISHLGIGTAGASRPAIGGFAYQLLRTVVTPFVPIDYSFPASFAFPGNLYEGGKRVWLSLAFLPCIGGALWVIFWKQPGFLLVLLTTALTAAWFAFAVYPSAVRHMGVVFVGFVVALWVARMEAPRPAHGRPDAAAIAVLGLLAMGAFGGCLAIMGQWIRPFSIDQITVDWLVAHEPPDAALVGFPDMRAEPIAILMRRRFYALDCRCEDSYVRFLNRRDGFTEASIPERLEEAVHFYRPRPVVLLAGDPLSDSVRATIAARGLALTERVHLTGAERDKEMTIFDVTSR